MAAARPPLDVRLQIVKQESVTQDVSFVNGQTKVVHSCIKGSPFKLELALVGNFDRNIINFNRFVITAVLLYDYEGGRGSEERQVSFVKTRPLEVLEYSVNDAGDRLTLVVVLHVLSSQHEHSLFLVKIANADLGLVAVSQPIRVVSKELQLKGKAKPRQTTSAAAAAAASRRPLTEEVVQYLQRIEAQSETHHQMLLTILQRLAVGDDTASLGVPQFQLPSQPQLQQPQQQQRSSSFSGEGVPGEPAAKRQKTDLKGEAAYNNNNTPSFEESFATLVRSFGALPRDQRNETVRRTVRACPDRETMSDLLGHLAAAGMMGSFGLASLNAAAAAANGVDGTMPYDTAPLPLPAAMMRTVKPEPTADLTDQIVDLGIPTSSAGSFSTPRLPSLPYLSGYEGNGVAPQMIQMQPQQLPLTQQQQGVPEENERKSAQYQQAEIDTNRLLYNDIFASWPYDNLNSLSQSQSL
jgi:hypothetical protein